VCILISDVCFLHILEDEQSNIKIVKNKLLQCTIVMEKIASKTYVTQLLAGAIFRKGERKLDRTYNFLETKFSYIIVYRNMYVKLFWSYSAKMSLRLWLIGQSNQDNDVIVIIYNATCKNWQLQIIIILVNC